MIKKVLLDTDIGTDIDDAITMSYLLKQKECEIVGITVTGGETIRRAKLASVMCYAGGKGDILIYPGPERPLIVGFNEPQYFTLTFKKHTGLTPRNYRDVFLKNQ